MQKHPIGWVEIPVTDLERAEKFYKDFFGYACERQPEMNGYTMSWFPTMDENMDKGYGSACTLMKGEGYVPSHEGPQIYFTAPEETVEKSLEKAKEHDITVLVPATSIGKHGFFGVIEDSEGNSIAIHSMKG
jgi:predicted enzyme related to lactoylglutathione lyase